MLKNGKIPKWPVSEQEKKLRKFLKKLKKEAERGRKWLFFYQPINKMDEFLHMFDVVAIVYIAWRLFSI